MPHLADYSYGLPDPQKRPRLLVVDDQPVIIQALYQAFAADYQVLIATSGEQALSLCASRQPDLVLLDVMMPGLDGYEVCRRLKADPDTRDIPVIFVTAQEDEEAETRGLDAGAVDFITKPIHPKVVRARVRTHVSLKRHSDVLRHLVYIDGLTGVYNRRYFDERFEVECRRATRSGLPLSLLILDVDHFKRYNDHYGHQAGDDCLRRVAALLRSSLLRPADLIARYGGEEFACVLPETGLRGAVEVAERIEASVRGAAIEHVQGAVGGIVTVSIGVASLDNGPQGRGSADMLGAADAALYRAKGEGRARVREAAPF